MSSEGIEASKANGYITDLISDGVWVQLHTGHPGANGTSNVATNNTRKQVTWGTPSGGSVANITTALTWPSVPATETYLYFSLWTASTSGTFRGSGAISGGAVSSGQTFQAAIGAIVFSLLIAS